MTHFYHAERFIKIRISEVNLDCVVMKMGIVVYWPVNKYNCGCPLCQPQLVASVCLGDGQTEAEGIPSQGGRGDALLRRMSSHLT